MDLFLLVVEGFFVKTVASFDDTLTRIPVISYLTKTKQGRVAFSIGTILALSAILILAVFFSEVLKEIPHTRIIASVLIFILALLIYFDVFIVRSTNKLASKFESESIQNLFQIMKVGFLVSFITLIDDSFVLIPLFLHDNISKVATLSGVYLAAFVQITLVIYFGHKLEKIKFKKEIASASLILLSILVYLGIV